LELRRNRALRLFKLKLTRPRLNSAQRRRQRAFWQKLMPTRKQSWLRQMLKRRHSNSRLKSDLKQPNLSRLVFLPRLKPKILRLQTLILSASSIRR